MEELNRLKRYASWIRRLVVSVWGFPKDITKLLVPTPSDAQPFLHFTLRELDWWAQQVQLLVPHHLPLPAFDEDRYQSGSIRPTVRVSR